MSKQMNIPILRFPEFTGEWEKKKLGEVAESVDYRGRAPIKTEAGYFLITAKNIKKGYIDYECSKEFVGEDDYLNVMSKGLPLVGDILFTTEAPIGNIAQLDRSDIALAQRVIKFRGKELIENEYLLHCMLSDVFQKKISEKAIGTTVQGISGKELHKIFVSFPTLPEQAKIATFLTAVDQKIQALKKKHSLLAQYKKGVMQKLFSQELRFKDENGEEFAEWEVNKLGEYIKLYRGSSPRPINLFTTKESNGVNWIKIGDTKGCKNYLINNIEEKITIEGAKKSREVFKGELILANSMSFGKTYLLGIDGYIYDGWFVLREFEQNFDKQFLHQLLNSEFLQKQYKTLSTGGVVQKISSEVVWDTFL
jgi:type I restriction enzyme, S subunit